MALSDECCEMLWRLEAATAESGRRDIVSKFVGEIAVYASPPYRYGHELQTLVDGCNEYLGGSSKGNDDPLERIKFLAGAIRDYLDTPPTVKKLNS